MLRSPWSNVLFLSLAGMLACSGLVKGAYVGPPDNGTSEADTQNGDASFADSAVTDDVCTTCEDTGEDGATTDPGVGKDTTGDGTTAPDDGNGPEDPGIPLDPGKDGIEPIPCGETTDCTGKLYSQGEGTCNKAVCAEGMCVIIPAEIGTPCDDGNRCRKKDTCQPGEGMLYVCTPGPEVVLCDDGDPCTDDICVPTTGGCMTKANQGACDDGNPCTTVDTCTSGMCVGSQNECPCGQDGDCAEHDDDNPCNGTLVCLGSFCEVKSGSKVVCPVPDGAPCRVSACDPASGECVVADAEEGTACDDGYDCSQGDRCVAGKCAALTGESCDDDNPCTNDWCDAQLQCQHAFNENECEPGRCVDGSHISASVCTAGACSAPFETKCDDENLCTDDTCSAATGCKHTKITGACKQSRCENFHFYPAVYCDDDNQCAEQIPVDCRDASPCTEDICDSVKGCEIGEIVGWCPSDIPGCVGSCSNNVCTFPTETLDGTDQDCDGFADEDFDLDHDGVCAAATCTVQQPDVCPTVWSPDNQPAWCYPVTTAWTRMREIVLRETGFADRASPLRRTAEVVEIPLRNGYLDGSVIGWWPLDGGVATEGSGNGVDGKVTGCTSATGAFGDAESGLRLAGASSSILFTGADLGCRARTFMAWIRLDATTGIAGRILANGSASIGVSSGQNTVDCTFGAGTPVVSSVGVLDGTWHHVACVLAEGRVHLFLDGVLDAAGAGGTGTCASPDAGVNRSGALKGVVDDLVLLDRPASPFEIQAAARSLKPYGTSLVPGARPDFDDVRVTAGTDPDSPQVAVELVGVRPRSSSDFEDIVAFWKLDGNGQDVLGLHDGSGVAPASEGRFGDDLGALTPGAGGGIIVPYASTLDVQNLTLEAWVRPSDEDLGSGQHAIIGRANDACCWDLGISDGALQLRVKVGPAWTTVAAPLDPDVAGRWTHVAGTFDGSNARLFVNGVQEASIVSIGAIGYSGSTRLVIGDNPAPDGLAGEPFFGSIDEAVFSEIARGAAYMWSRTHPAIPVARFLAGTGVVPTAGANFEFPRYALRWANPDAASAPATTLSLDGQTRCDGLLTGCFGYGGLWRFDGYGASVPDLSDAGNAGTLSGGAVVGPGTIGPGIALDGVAGRMTAGPAGLPASWTGQMAVEAVLTPGASCTGTARIAGRQDASGGFGIDYVCATGKVSGFAGPSASAVKAESSAALSAGQEHAVAVVLRGGRLSVFVDGVEAGYSNAAAPSLAAGSAFLVGSSGAAAFLPGFVRTVRWMLRGLATDELMRAGERAWKLGAITDAAGKPVQ